MEVKECAASGRSGHVLPLVATVGLVVSSAAVAVTAVSRVVPEPYMDEVFHVRQTQQYCAWNFTGWDPKITTPPGLYLLAALYAELWQLPSKAWRAFWQLDSSKEEAWACTPAGLRHLNAGLACLCFLALQRLHRRLHPQQSSVAFSWWMALAASLLPLHFFFIFLFYTDVLSTTLVLTSYLALLENREHVSAIFSFAAVFVRQTNAVWAAFILGVGVYNRLSPQTDREKQPSNIVLEIPRLIRLAWQLKWSLLHQFWGLVGVLVLFVTFLQLNGGVVLGDKTNHVAVFHPTQLLYLVLYMAVVMAPVHFTPSRIFGLAERVGSWAGRSPVLVAGLGIAIVTACIFTVKYYTLVHPFTLADNRHYVFYIWRKVLARHPLARYALIPAYMYSTLSIGSSLSDRQSGVWILMFAICSALTLVPAWLVELRYYTIPTMLTVLHTKPLSLGRVCLVVVGCFCVNSVTLAVFLYKPFKWSDGSVARFMW